MSVLNGSIDTESKPAAARMVRRRPSSANARERPFPAICRRLGMKPWWRLEIHIIAFVVCSLVCSFPTALKVDPEKALH